MPPYQPLFGFEIRPASANALHWSLLMSRLITLLALMVITMCPVGALAQGYPNKPVRVIVPYAPGGATDILMRVLAKQLTESTGQPFVIENHGGAGATIGAAMAAKSPPDGYTIVVVSGVPFLINQFMFSKLPYDTVTDFEPISRFASVPMLLVSHPSFPADTPAGFVAYARDNPGKVNFGAPDEMTHLAMTIISQSTKMKVTIVPYKGAGPAITDLIGGHIPMMMSSSSAIMPYLKDGRVKPLAITTSSRLPSLPQVPTVSETILPSFELNAWFGIFAPAKTPKDVVNYLHAAIANAVRVPGVKDRFEASGASPIEMLSPEEFAAYVKAERDRWGKAFQESGLQRQ
jgi:tripartite-type tricarboxylate transporter receptor subunit TctC